MYKQREGQMPSATRRTFISLLGAAGAAALFGLAGCSETGQTSSAQEAGQDADAGSTASSDAPSADSTSQEAVSESADASGKVLVAYFTGTGNTQAVAQELAGYLGADLFEAVPEDAYEAEDLNFNDRSSRVCQEYAGTMSQDIPLVQNAPDGFEAYETVLVGYPIWWGGAAWPIRRFISENDFAGKTVIPFCTSLSSGLGQSAQRLEELDSAGSWQDGRRFAEHPDLAEVDSWADSLGI